MPIVLRKTKKSKPRKWSQKYKNSINCRNPKGFSQKQYCKYGRTNYSTKYAKSSLRFLK